MMGFLAKYLYFVNATNPQNLLIKLRTRWWSNMLLGCSEPLFFRSLETNRGWMMEFSSAGYTRNSPLYSMRSSSLM